MQKKVVIAKEGVWGRGGARVPSSGEVWRRISLEECADSGLLPPLFSHAVAIVVAIVVATDLRPKTVTEALQIHACTSLLPLLLPLLLRRICDPKPSQTRYKSTRLRHCHHCCCNCCCDPQSVAEALQIHAFTALSQLLLPRMCDPKPNA